MDGMMNRTMLIAVMATVAVGRLAAVTVGPEFALRYPQPDMA